MILITGGAGTLGRAWKKLLGDDAIALDNSEWACAEDKGCVLGDFCDYPLKGIDTVIHCAAFKHINLGQDNPDPFVVNNVIKTRQLFKRCYIENVKVLFISTDKAVEPISTYGFTKALGEDMARYHNFSVARLPNIMGSSGSVLPLWEKQISEGKPLTVTHPSMMRHFCDVDEAVKEIWERFLTGEKLIIPKSEVITLETLIQKTLDKHNIRGYYLRNIVGLRCREKMVEKLRWSHEEDTCK